MGACHTFPPNELLPEGVGRDRQYRVGHVGTQHPIVGRGGTLVMTGGTTGFLVPLNLLQMIADQLTITGSIMGTLDDMQSMMNLIAGQGLAEIGAVLPMERAEEAFREMWEGRICGKTVFTR